MTAARRSSAPRRPAPRFSIVAPILNESTSIAPLAREIAEACAPIGPFEAIFVDDGSTDGTPEQIAALRAEYPWLRLVCHAKACGQSAAIRSGVLAARAEVICTIDGDGQNPPAEIPGLVRPFLENPPGPGLVAGQRSVRHDSFARRLASRLANRLRGALLRDGARDTGCGLKAFRRDDFLALPHFDHMHRFLPALFRREGHEVVFVEVAHRPRTGGASKYSNLGRGFTGALDLLGVWWLMRRRRLPEIIHRDD